MVFGCNLQKKEKHADIQRNKNKRVFFYCLLHQVFKPFSIKKIFFIFFCCCS